MNADEWNKNTAEQEFEAALTRALRRVEAPENFAAQLMARAEAETAGDRKQRAESSKPWYSQAFGWGWKPAWGAMAALLVATVLTGHVVREHRAEERVRASRDFDVSVRITDQALDHARKQLRKAGVPVDGDGQ